MAREHDKTPPPATDVRLTFRTLRTREEKLERIARARGLMIGDRYSIGAAINWVIDSYDDSAEHAKLREIERAKVKLKVRMKQRRSHG